MWLIVLLVYCAVCWTAGYVMTRPLMPQVADRVAARGVPVVRFGFCAIVIAPIIMPIVVWIVATGLIGHWRRLAVLRWALKTVREYEFVKVNSLYLAEPIRRLFERQTPAFFQLGFSLLGDFRMKPEPVEVHDRIFQSADGETLGTICAVVHSGGTSFISVLSDGTSVHTTSVRNPRPERVLEPSDQLAIRYSPDTSIEDMYRHHRGAIEERSIATGSHVLRFAPERFREVMIYDQRIFNRWRSRYRDLSGPSPSPDFSGLFAAAIR
jgi:hypothetical protein